MTRLRLAIPMLVACAFAAAALGQNADQNTSGPTRNDYRLRLVQPLEGAQIVGQKIPVIVDTEIPAERDTKADVHSMPRPRIDVFLDDLYQGTMHDGDNVLELNNVQYGQHEIVLLAKNMSSEIIDRKVLHVMNVAPRVVAAETHPAPLAAPPAVAAPPPPATEPAPAPVKQELPKAGTNKAVLLVAGVILLLGGFVVRRFRMTAH